MSAIMDPSARQFVRSSPGAGNLRLPDAAPPGVSRSTPLSDKLRGAFLLMQPFETVLLQALPASLFMLIAWPHAGIGRLLTLALSVIAIYGAVGSLNDYCDYELDKFAKPAKPLVRGLLSRSYAPWQALVLAAIGLLLSWVLNGLTAAVAAVVLALGIWYDVWAKRSLLSWVPYAIGVPSLPVWGFAAAGRFQPVLLWAYPFGALLSLGLNVSNTLPDQYDDAAYGLRGLVHRLTLAQAVGLAWGCFAGAIVGFAAGAPLLGNNWKILAPGLATGTLLLLFMMADYLTFRSKRSLKRNWYASGFLSVITGLAWIGSLPRS
jgi:4-hydroxybenzoate polyprenyltransferase